MSDIVKDIFTVASSKVVKRSQHPIKILPRETITVLLQELYTRKTVTHSKYLFDFDVLIIFASLIIK